MLLFISRYLTVAVFCTLLIFCAIGTASADSVSTYDDLYDQLPGGTSNKEFNSQSIEEAQEFVITRQSTQRRRDITFVRPVDIFFLNEKYISVSFEVQVKPGNQTAIIALLLENLANERIKFYNGLYILWISDKDLEDYKSISDEQLCKYYQEIGADDCKPTFRRSKIEALISKKADLNHHHRGGDITSGVINEKYIDDSITRDSELQAALSRKVDVDVIQTMIPQQPKVSLDLSSVDALEKRVALLEAEVAKLTALLKGVIRNGNTLVMSNMNLQLINGRGKTDSVNGTGNLIIGYNEPKSGAKRAGSHNLVIGPENAYESYGGIVAGKDNEASGEYSVAVGGEEQVASGEFSSVFGGKSNKATGPHTSISGGMNRTVAGTNPHFTQ